MSDLTLLWVNLTRQKSRLPTTRIFEDFFKIRPNAADSLTRVDEIDVPDALCFDCDFPDRMDLGLLEETKRLHPSIPILFLTVQHSEELAIWAFRARVWDYFAKPVKRRDVERCYESLCKIDKTSSIRSSVRENPPLPAASKMRQSGTVDQRVLGPAVAYVQSHYSNKITQAQMAELCGMSTFQFSRTFHSAFGQTFQDFLLRCRLEHAQELLLNPALGISDVGYAVGFSDASYFGRVFRRSNNMSPSQWRHHQLGGEQPCLRVDLPGLV